LDKDGIDGYNESVWTTLGHRIFELSPLMDLEADIEWWDTEDE